MSHKVLEFLEGIVGGTFTVLLIAESTNGCTFLW